MDSKITPLVSALCMVYNQAPYLRQCLERIIYIQTRNRNLLRIAAPSLIPLSLPAYHRMHGCKWFSIMRYDISQCLRFSSLRLTRRLPER